jgi:hypothetical protein
MSASVPGVGWASARKLTDIAGLSMNEGSGAGLDSVDLRIGLSASLGLFSVSLNRFEFKFGKW